MEWLARRQPELETQAAFTERYGFLLGSFLFSRQIDLEKADDFLFPRLEQLSSPLRLKNLENSAIRLADAVEQDESIVIYADYDMDGMSGLAILVSFLKLCKATRVSYYQPKRLEEGYGVHPQAIRDLADQGAQVIVTVDTGISAVDAAKVAREKNITLIITDHHLQNTEAPDTPYIVNPNQKSDESGLSFLSGAGVAFYLLLALRAELRKRNYFTQKKIPEPDARLWLDLFLLGTVADVVDLKEENRLLCKAALAYFQRSTRVGLKTLIDTLFPEHPPQSTKDIAFSITPKLNAASRMGKAELSTELLLCEDPRRAKELVDEILKLNTQRSLIQESILKEAETQILEQIQKDAPVLLVYGPWHEGVLGIVAARLVETYSRPAIVLNLNLEEGLLRGSMRTRGHFSCVQCLNASSQHLKRFGGHRMAAGLQLEATALNSFRDSLWTQAQNFLENHPAPTEALYFDGELTESLRIEDIETLSHSAPWGPANPEPLFLIRNLPTKEFKILKEKHLKGKFRGFDFIGFNKAFILDSSSPDLKIDALVVPEIHRFRQTITIQLRIEHVRISEPLTHLDTRSGSRFFGNPTI